MNDFNKRLQKALQLRNLSQSELCKKTGIPKSAMSQYVSGDYIPKRERTYVIAQALNISEGWLMGYDVPIGRAEPEITKGGRGMEGITARGCDSAKIETVIVTRALKGSGTENDPVREVVQYWSLEVELLFEKE